MKALWIIVFAGIAAIGNALFALGQRGWSGTGNGLLFVGGGALIACVLSFAFSPFAGPMELAVAFRGQWKALFLSGAGLFLTYVGFNLLYTRYGAFPYVVYAVMSILTTSIGVGVLLLKETANRYEIAAVVLAVLAIMLFSIGQSRA